jgi:HEAT repeat protein
MLPASQYANASVHDLLNEAAHGRIGLDQRWLKAIVDRGPAAAKELIEFGLHCPETARVELTDDIVAILRYFHAPEAMPYFVEVIRRDPTEVPDDIYFALGAYGESAIEPLVKLYHEVEEEESGDIAFALAALRPRDPRVLQILVERLEYDMEDAALALGLYGDPAARPALEKFLAEDPENPYVKDALAEIAKPAPAVAAEEPFDIWGAYPEVAAPDLSAMSEADRAELLEKGSNAEERRDAAYSFLGDPLPEKIFQVIVKAARSDPDETVRGEAWKTLGTNVHQRPGIAADLWTKLKDKSAPKAERGGCLVGLAFGDDPENRLVPFIEDFYQDPEARRDAMEAMARSNDRRWASHFIRHLGDADLEIQRCAIRGVGFCQVRGESNRLKEFFRDEHLRMDALYAYALATPGEPSPARMRAILKKIGDETLLDERERELVMIALDERMQMAGKPRVFLTEPDEDEEDEE